VACVLFWLGWMMRKSVIGVSRRAKKSGLRKKRNLSLTTAVTVAQQPQFCCDFSSEEPGWIQAINTKGSANSTPLCRYGQNKLNQ